MYKRLLVAVDGSAASNAALMKAIELAKEDQSELRVVHVIDETAVPWEEQGMTRRQRALDLLARASDKIMKDAQDTIRRAGRQSSCMQLVRDRRPDATGDLIAAAAKSWGADLIVIGSRGYGPIRRALLGSVDAAVMRNAAVPVLPVTASSSSGPQRQHLDNIRPSAPRSVGLA